MDVDRNELIEALTKVKPGIANKEQIEQSTHFIFDESEIISYNSEISIAYPFDSGIECTVESNLLYKLVSKMKEDTISIELEGNTLNMQCGGIKAELPIIIDSTIFDRINIIADEQGKDDAWKELPADFLDAVRFCAFSASTDKTLGMLTCVWVEGKDVLSFDRYRASWYQMETEAPNDFYLEAAHIAKLCNFDPPVEYCITKAWAHFQIPNGAVVSILLTIPDKLLDLRKKFNDFKPITKIDLPESLSEAVEAASLAVELLEKPDQKVLIRFESDTIFCAGSSERGKIEKEIHLEEPLDINPFSIKTSPKSMIEVLDKAAHLLVGKHAGMFKSTEKAGYQHLIGLNMEK